MSSQRGTLEITVIDADLTRDTEAFGKMDPYVVLELNEFVARTTFKQKAGKKPVWNENFAFRTSIGDILNVKVLEFDSLTSSDIIGNCEIKVLDFQSETFREKITFNKKESGSVNFTMKFIPDFEIEQLKNFEIEKTGNKLNDLESNLILERNEKSRLLEMKKLLEKKNEGYIKNLDNSKREIKQLSGEITENENSLKRGANGKARISDIEVIFRSEMAKINPFIRITLPNSNESYCSEYISNSGNKPIWKKCMEFNLDNETSLLIEVYNKKLIDIPELIGSGSLSVFNLTNNRPSISKIPIYKNGLQIASLKCNSSLEKTNDF